MRRLRFRRPGLTAWQGLFVHGGLTRDQAVLIHGAGGGVGSFAVQLAHAAGAYVIGTGRAGAAELVAELGADEFDLAAAVADCCSRTTWIASGA